MIRLKMVVEGQTEETFVRDVLAEHLLPFKVYPSPRRVETGRKRLRAPSGGPRTVFRGGMTTYQRAKSDILRWIKQEEKSPEVYVTTMFDLYRLPADFPAFREARTRPTPALRVEVLEEALGRDIGFPRFIPYIQLHEFEALVLADPARIAPQFERREDDAAIRKLVALAGATAPEDINDGEQTAPSKRIIQEIPEYDGVKSSAGPQIVQAIGLKQIRKRCPHFHAWLTRLESLRA